MFKSATFKLTAWYAAIIIAISLLFSAMVYTVASSEVGSRLDDYLESTSQLPYFTNKSALQYLHDLQLQRAHGNLIGSLLLTNIAIWLAGGIGSYYLARRTLRPIEEAHEAQSRFTSDASHELRTPLASMKLELEVALRDPDLKKAEMRELLASNLEEVNRLSRLSQTLLQLSRLDHEGIKREKISLDTVALDVISHFKQKDRIKYAPAKVPAVYANELNVEELLTILIDNALKYSPAGSAIHLQLIKQKNMSGFEVRNGGEGIDPQDLPHIFDRFYRADTSRTDSGKKGYGLGLSLAKKIVELHEGELTVTSAKNQDTTFRVLLPRASRVHA